MGLLYLPIVRDEITNLTDPLSGGTLLGFPSLHRVGRVSGKSSVPCPGPGNEDVENPVVNRTRKCTTETLYESRKLFPFSKRTPSV